MDYSAVYVHINSVLKIKRGRGAPWGSKTKVAPERSAAAAPWLPSPTRQRVKLKDNFKPVALKHDLQAMTNRDIKSLLPRCFILL
ncbi:hypothetical protein CWB72_03300 [Pseudoalteromonas phenolica]|nr:hypothetical protein CWB72_03300 [Pseudoalteromonas phenolica]